jgi:hypothetical protein
MIAKRRRCLSDAELGRIAVRVFKGERRSAIAASLGVAPSYLSRLLADAGRRGVYRIVVACTDETMPSVEQQNQIAEANRRAQEAADQFARKWANFSPADDDHEDDDSGADGGGWGRS